MWRRQRERYTPKKGASLVTWSVVHVAPTGFEKYLPYVMGIVEFEDKTRLTVQIVDCDPLSLAAGIMLEPVFRQVYADDDDGILHYSVKYRPLQ
ncbi:MAG: hypothetical protein TR69_WS6001000012 [candidate division WS6 bacterium OLB20]|uniref:ChsH2 C-terminal OB-fold domain-containing protein n=1 Tax=candidate division WS6 bacterium OLB20 TaxID=1617426 RepID=A0A136M0Y0_9BACT|nr:MAG: hypothetical protein TR69_WS6001000012 [candidate division WS6 bacterium OLB20]